MKTMFLFAAFFTAIFCAAQQQFVIHGKITRSSKSKEVIVSGGFGKYSGTINPDGSFMIKGTLMPDDAGVSFIKTDQSSSDVIWLEPGEYKILCKEITIAGNPGYYFRTPEVDGPANAEIYNGFMQPIYYASGTTTEERKQYYRDHYTGYIDSIFKLDPRARPLPEMIRFASTTIGDEAASFFYSLLSDTLKTASGAQQLEYYFKRKEKIAKEVYFEDFRMKDVDGNTFQLSSLNKKLILVDFWSSDCYPCRKKHEKVVAWYKKYSSKGLAIVSVSLDDDRKEWLKAVEKDKMTWINVSDLKGWHSAIAEAYFIKSLPYSFWLDKDRKIIATELTENEIEAYLK